MYKAVDSRVSFREMEKRVLQLVFGLEDDHEGQIPTPYFADQMTPTPAQMTPTQLN